MADRMDSLDEIRSLAPEVVQQIIHQDIFMISSP